MKKITYESWVHSFVERLSDYFNLAGWEIAITQAKEDKPNSSGEGWGTYASMDINSAYQMAEMTLYPVVKKDFEEKNFARIVTRLTHEFVHIFLDPFQDAMHPHLSITSTPAFMNILEQQTQKLTMVFLKTLPKDVIPPR